MSKNYIRTDWAKYGVLDSNELEQREQFFYEQFEKRCQSEKAKLRKLIDDKERDIRFERMMTNIQQRTRSKPH